MCIQDEFLFETKKHLLIGLFGLLFNEWDFLEEDFSDLHLIFCSAGEVSHLGVGKLSVNDFIKFETVKWIFSAYKDHVGLNVS